jgi:hypothetical protein
MVLPEGAYICAFNHATQCLEKLRIFPLHSLTIFRRKFKFCTNFFKSKRYFVDFVQFLLKMQLIHCPYHNLDFLVYFVILKLAKYLMQKSRNYAQNLHIADVQTGKLTENNIKTSESNQLNYSSYLKWQKLPLH